MSERIVYSEKPHIPSSITVSFLAPVLGSLLIVWGLLSMHGIVTWVGVFVLLIGFMHAIPFFNRRILLTNKEIQVELWWFKDKIPIEDVLSIERVNRLGRPLAGWGVTPMGFGYRLLFFLHLGVIKSRGTRWYVFGDRETYLKISKRNGEAVCIGMENPEEFIDRWKALREL